MKKSPSDKELIEGSPDRGCKWSFPCIDCPYQKGEVVIKLNAMCVDDYPKGVTSLVGDMRRSIIEDLYGKRFCVAILSKIFNQSLKQTQKDIERYRRSK